MDNFEIIDAETDEEFDLLDETINLYFFVKEGTYYCEDAYYELMVKFDTTANEWVQIEYDEDMDGEDIEMEDALQQFKDNLPFALLATLRDQD